MGEEAPVGGTPFARKTREEEAGDSKVGGGREVTQVVADLVAGADGGGGGEIRRKAQSRKGGPHKELLKKG